MYAIVVFEFLNAHFAEITVNIYHNTAYGTSVPHGAHINAVNTPWGILSSPPGVA